LFEETISKTSHMPLKSNSERSPGGDEYRLRSQSQPATSSGHPELETASFLAAVVESSSDAIITKDLNGIITSWNQGAERIFGYKPFEAIGQPITILIPPDHIKEESFILARIRAGERIDHFETVRRRKDGTELDISLTVSPVRNADGTIIGASKIARDITSHRREREQLRQSEERFRVTLSSIGDGVIATDEKSRVTFMNPVAENLTGWRSEEAAGIPLDKIFKIVNEITRQPVENPVSHVIDKGHVVGLGNHTTLIAKDGREQPIDDSAAPIRRQDGSLAGVVLVFRDAREQRANEMTALKLAAFVENSEDAIYSTDLDAVVTGWNPSAERIFGYSRAEVMDRPLSASIIPPDRVDEDSWILSRIVRGERIAPYETVRVRKDGSRVDIAMTVSPMKDIVTGGTTGIFKIARDITQRKTMEHELATAHSEMKDYAENLEALVNERTAKLQQTVADLESFSFTISHDLRSPLRAMEGFSQAVLSEYSDKLDDRGRQFLERINNAAIRMDKLILEVLTYSRISRSELSIVRVSLDKLVEDVLQTYPEIKASSAEIVIEQPLQPVLGAPVSLVLCVSNLLTNAVKFIPSGARAKVRVWTEKRDSTVKFFVEDKGIGIPENLQSKIFEPFQRGHPRAGYEGTGMGLAIVRKAIQRMNGDVGVKSRDGHGSTFWLELPAAPDVS
jgi:PAS domain S-box-containing protein